jgi:hypothetical protein
MKTSDVKQFVHWSFILIIIYLHFFCLFINIIYQTFSLFFRFRSERTRPETGRSFNLLFPYDLGFEAL